MDLLEWVQRMAMKVVRELEHLSCEERVRELEKRRLCGDRAFHYLKVASRRDGEGLFSWECSDRIAEVTVLNQKRFR